MPNLPDNYQAMIQKRLEEEYQGDKIQIFQIMREEYQKSPFRIAKSFLTSYFTLNKLLKTKYELVEEEPRNLDRDLIDSYTEALLFIWNEFEGLPAIDPFGRYSRLSGKYQTQNLEISHVLHVLLNRKGALNKRRGDIKHYIKYRKPTDFEEYAEYMSTSLSEEEALIIRESRLEKLIDENKEYYQRNQDYCDQNYSEEDLKRYLENPGSFLD